VKRTSIFLTTALTAVIAALALSGCDTPEELSQKGVDSLNNGNYEEAVKYFDRLLKQDSVYPYAPFYRGAAYLALGENQKAVDDFTAELAVRDDDYAAYNNRGIAYFRLEEWEKAIDDLGEFIKHDETNVGAYYYRGEAFSNTGQYRNAAASFTKAIAIEPGNMLYYHSRGIAYFAQENWQVAVNDFNTVLEADLENETVLKAREAAQQQIAKIKEAKWQRTKAELEYYLNLGLAAQGRPPQRLMW
jgi:tetratricopeptide (TPR) repeat protein